MYVFTKTVSKVLYTVFDDLSTIFSKFICGGAALDLLGKRYFVCLALIFLAFSRISFEYSGVKILVVFTLALGIFALILKKIDRKNKNLNIMLCLSLVAACVGVLNTGVLLYGNAVKIEKYVGERHIYGYVASVEQRENFLSEHIVHIESIDGERVSIEAPLVTDFASELTTGDFFECDVQISRLEDYDEIEYLRSSEPAEYPLICTVSENEEILYPESEFRVRIWLSSLGAKLSAILRVALGSENGALANALLLGNREMLRTSVLRDFKRAGVYHMLALSGLHVAILVGMLDALLKKLYISKRLRIAMSTLLCLFYVALTGFLLSACRAMLMLFITYLSFNLRRRSDALTSLFLGVSVIVLVSPSSVLDTGLMLSFLSTLGIICSSEIKKKINIFGKIKIQNGFLSFALDLFRYIAYLFLTSWCVFVATLPIIAEKFGEVSLATFFSNLFMGTFCEAFMITAIFTLLFCRVPLLCTAFSRVAIMLGTLMTDITSAISNVRGVVLSLEYPGTDYIVWLLFIFSAVLLAIKIPKKQLIGLPSVAFICIMCVGIAAFEYGRGDRVRAEFLLGDTLVLSSSEGVYICDASDGRKGALYDGIARAKENCFTEIDGVILTHYHSWQVVSLAAAADSFVLHSVYMPMPQNSTEGLVMRALVRVLSEERDVRVYLYEAGNDLEILSGELTVSDRFYIAGKANPGYAFSYRYGDSRITVVEPRYFDTYFESSGAFADEIEHSNTLIFGSDGNACLEDFEIYGRLLPECEIYFTDFDTFAFSDYEAYLGERKIYFNTVYKKYDLK